MAKFRLFPTLDQNKYQLTDSFRTANKWKAYTYEANSGGTVGEFDDVGYIFVSLKDNSIVPIARGDEHHTGYDLLADLNIPDKHMYPLFVNGGNYIYRKSDINTLKLACQKWLEYGGNDFLIKGSSELTGLIMTAKKIATTDELNFDFSQTEHLGEIGQIIFNTYEALSKSIIPYANTPDDEIPIRARNVIFNNAKKVCDVLGFYENALPLPWGSAEELMKDTKSLKQNNAPMLSLQNLYFGFKSLKNEIHNHLRKFKPNDYDARRDIQVWGNINLAIDMLGKL